MILRRLDEMRKVNFLIEHEDDCKSCWYAIDFGLSYKSAGYVIQRFGYLVTYAIQELGIK